MKKQIVTALGVMIIGAASYAATYMHANTKDGKTVKFDVVEVEEVTFEDKDTSADTVVVADHEYVDLGLPSGLLWATCNIGATNPEEYGDYFAWGETTPKEKYDWLSYKYAAIKDGDLDSVTKYNRTDSLTRLLAVDDAATAIFGDEWRMPTLEELNELIDNCEYLWIDVNGVRCLKFTGSNGSTMILPLAGFRRFSESYDVQSYGHYWTSTRHEEYDNVASSMYFGLGGTARWNDDTRDYGFPVRAVRVKK